MILFANAKVNVGLYVTEKRNDGFHNIETVFFPIPFCDIIEIMPAEEWQWKQTGLAIPGSEDSNLCKKAWLLMQKKYQVPPVFIHLHKQIPTGAGLGGGSSDAAWVLKGLNMLFNLGLDDDALAAHALTLGSDCPFFIYNKPVFASGRGNEFTPVELNLKEWGIVLLNPDIHVGTAEAYAGVVPSAAPIDLKIIDSSPENWDNVTNDFEASVGMRYPIIEEYKQLLYSSGAVYASMSGSGSTVYGLYKPGQNIPDISSVAKVIFKGIIRN